MLDLMWNSLEIDDNAGATIVDDTGEINVKDETRTVETHFRWRLQLRGLAGSFGPDQVTLTMSSVVVKD